MEKIRGYANIFEINAIYLQITNELLKKPYDPTLYRNYKEIFKCTVANECKTIISIFDKFDNIYFQPPEELQESFSLQDIEPLNCICSYINNTELLIKKCPYKRQFPKIIKRKPYKLKKYTRYIFKTSKLAFKNVISFIAIDNKDDLKRYRSALIILELALKTFYLSPLPKLLSPKYFNLCCGKSNTFKNYYTYCDKSDLYQRKPYNEVERIQHIGITFNNDVAWYITEFKLNHYIKLTEKFLNN